MILFGIFSLDSGFDPLILLVFGLILEAVFGWFSALARGSGAPVVLVAGFVSLCDRKLNREGRTSGDRAARGAIVALLISLVAGVAGWGIAWLTQNIAVFWILETIIIALSLDQRGTNAIVQKCGRAIRGKNLPEARKHLALISGQPVNSMDLHHLARTGLEASAVAIARGVAGPVFWYVLFGLPGLMVFRAVDIMAELVGHQTDRHRAFDIKYRPASRNLGGIKLESNIALSSAAITLSRMIGIATGVSLRGDLALKLDGPKPALTANLTAGALDLNKYLPKAQRASLKGDLIWRRHASEAEPPPRTPP